MGIICRSLGDVQNRFSLFFSPSFILHPTKAVAIAIAIATASNTAKNTYIYSQIICAFWFDDVSANHLMIIYCHCRHIYKNVVIFLTAIVLQNVWNKLDMLYCIFIHQLLFHSSHVTSTSKSDLIKKNQRIQNTIQLESIYIFINSSNRSNTNIRIDTFSVVNLNLWSFILQMCPTQYMYIML